MPEVIDVLHKIAFGRLRVGSRTRVSGVPCEAGWEMAIRQGSDSGEWFRRLRIRTTEGRGDAPSGNEDNERGVHIAKAMLLK